MADNFVITYYFYLNAKHIPSNNEVSNLDKASSVIKTGY